MARSPKAGSSRAPEPEAELAPPLARLAALLDEKPEALAAGDEDIRAASLAAAKFVFDKALKTESAAERHIVPFLASLQPSAAPKTRSQTRAEAAGKGKGKQKAEEPELPAWRATPLDALYVDGAEDEQVWAQLDLRAGALCAMLGHILEEEPDDDDDEPRKVVDEDAMDEDDDSLDVGDDAMLDTLGDSSDDDDDSESEPGSSELDALLSSDSSDGEHSELEQDLRDPSDDDSESDSEVDLDAKGTGKSKGGRKSVLDDGFFSLADFNAEADAAEARSRSSGRLADDSDDSEEEEDVDIFADVDAPGDFDEDDLESSGELYYRDFFDPPSRKALAAASPSKKKKKKKGFQFDNDNADDAPQPERKRTVQFHDKVRVKPIKPSPLRRRNLLLEKLMKEQGYTPGLAGLDDDDDSDDDDDEEGGGEGMDWDAEGSSTEEDELADGEEDEEDRGRAAIERLKDDLFADDDDTSGPADMSTHEKRMAELQAQIASLEAENVAPRAWTLMGEAAARSRPQNALLEEDLEFDRATRPVPAVTEEKVAGIEDLIRRRILENNFDDVERKRPESELAPSRRAQFEISDQKSQKSLAQLYEDEYSAAASGTATVDDRDGKLAKEHKELEKLWDGICYKLDALCNAHFTPKAPTAKITTIANVPAASLESALPTATAAAAMLAPEEVAARATARALVAKSEMTPEEKRRVRAREKERRQKRDSVVAAQGKVAQISSGGKPSRGSVKKEKEKALSAVTKGRGVTVVGKANGRDAKGKGHAKGKAPAPADGKKLKL